MAKRTQLCSLITHTHAHTRTHTLNMHTHPHTRTHARTHAAFMGLADSAEGLKAEEKARSSIKIVAFAVTCWRHQGSSAPSLAVPSLPGLLSVLLSFGWFAIAPPAFGVLPSSRVRGAPASAQTGHAERGSQPEPVSRLPLAWLWPGSSGWRRHTRCSLVVARPFRYVPPRSRTPCMARVHS